MCYNKNWIKIVDDLEKLFELWKIRKLIIFGKVCVINSLVILKFLYIGLILNFLDEGILKKIQSFLYNFIWNKKDRIKRNIQIGKIEDGGIGIVDILMKFKLIKVFWINYIFRKNSFLLIFVDSLCKEMFFDFEYFCKINVICLYDY